MPIDENEMNSTQIFLLLGAACAATAVGVGLTLRVLSRRGSKATVPFTGKSDGSILDTIKEMQNHM